MIRYQSGVGFSAQAKPGGLSLPADFRTDFSVLVSCPDISQTFRTAFELLECDTT